MDGNGRAGHLDARRRRSRAWCYGRKPRATVGVSACALFVSVATVMPGIRAAASSRVLSAECRGVSTLAARAECGVSSGGAKFGDVADAATRGRAGWMQALASCGEWCGVLNPDCRH